MNIFYQIPGSSVLVVDKLSSHQPFWISTEMLALTPFLWLSIYQGIF